MKLTNALIFIITASLIPALAFCLDEHIEYNITINNDGSASWRIIHVTDIDSPAISWEEFEQKLHDIINDSSETTIRKMTLDTNSLEMNTEINWETSSKTNEYIFLWENFSVVYDQQIILGDVFSEHFFADFYGDGELYIYYPQEYTISSISPTPNEQNNQVLHWYRSQDFSINPNIEFTQRTSPLTLSLSTSSIIILSSTVAGVFVIGFLILNHKRKQKDKKTTQPQNNEWREILDSKNQVLQLLTESGGSSKQSEISSNLRYSRAKTSILLSEMEKDKQIRRDKIGKNKIVYIIKREHEDQ
jgi:uncharacterized membrane protein